MTRRVGLRVLVLPLALALGACASHAPQYYENDGPPASVPAGLANVPDAMPRVEPINPYANRVYTALGRTYTPDTGDEPFDQRGMASWYGRQYHGNRTASGEPYDMFAMTAAHPTLPIPSYAQVTNVHDGRSVIVRVNDRGPFVQDRIIDLSYAAAVRLGIAGAGSGEVLVHKLTSREILEGTHAPALVQAAAPPPAPSLPSVASAIAIAPAATPTVAAALTPLPVAAMPAGPTATTDAAPAAAPRRADPTAADFGAPAAAPAVAQATTAPDATVAPKPLATAPAAPAVTVKAVPAKPAESAVAKAPATAGAPGGWAVQFGAFAVPAHASALREQLAPRLAALAAPVAGADAQSLRIETTGKLQRVLLGHFADRKSAQAAATQLARLLELETSVLKEAP